MAAMVSFSQRLCRLQSRTIRAMTDYLIAAVLFVAVVTTLVYLWKREHG